MSELLFNDAELRRLFHEREQEALHEVDSYPENKLLNTSFEDLVGFFEKKFSLQAPHLREDAGSIDVGETQVDVSRNASFFAPFGASGYVEGTYYALHVPFEGDEALFRYQPSSFSFNPPRGSVGANELVINRSSVEESAEVVRAALTRELGEIRRWLGWVAQDVDGFNMALRDKLRTRLEARKQRLLQSQGVAANLGFPLRRRADAPQTYAAPVVRSRLPAPPPASNAPYVPEPALPSEEYEHILSIMKNMALVLERNPRAFSTMKEEDLRQHFLVQLNGHYEGQATGETFNFQGKTDILIRTEGRNVFIAECKFWEGQAELTRAVDQLLGYTTWRDTKTALVVFNRNQNFSAILEKIPPTIRAHSAFKREHPHPHGETAFRCILGRPDDPSRELMLTVLAFNVAA